MALIYQAELTPTKTELLNSWGPSQPWWGTDSNSPAGAYRFDDPAGEVGVETHLLRSAAGRVLQVPLTYRSAPLPGAESALVGTMHHSVLGQRWIYDGCFDPVYLAALASAILTGGQQAELQVAGDDGAFRSRAATTRVAGSGRSGRAVPDLSAPTVSTSGVATTIRTAGLELTVRRSLQDEISIGAADTLLGTWPGTEQPVVLALALPVI
ncbi:MAG: hypothetical protein JWO63_2992 [Frankiales bacterium]|nr:hypothetical protein [Frankiales bacterium]